MRFSNSKIKKMSESIDQNINLLVDFRKESHANPEISEHEFNTQKRIVSFLKSHTNVSVSEIGKTGVLATLDTGIPGPVVMIRGDIDALPIQEVNTFLHRSKTDGVSHKCGHDGHTSILLGLAMKLSVEPLKKGKALLLFQPAEENGMGAQAVLADKQFQNLGIDYVFALHNLPGVPKHEIVVKEKEFTSNVKSIIIKLNGKTAHAAEPEQGYNPAMAMAEILHFADKHTYNHPESTEFFLMTPVYANLGEKAYGISAGYGEVHITIRSWSTNLMQAKCDLLVDFIEQKCTEQKLTPEVSWVEEFYANINHPDAVDVVRKSAEMNQLKVVNAFHPFRWGEDFGLFTQKFKGAMFGLGAGENTPALHNPDYDYPDDITPTGINMFYNILQQIL
jgi:amidohydrolase